MQVWQTFFILAHVWQTSVFLKRALAPGRQRKMVNGRSQILHALPCGSLVMLLVRAWWMVWVRGV